MLWGPRMTTRCSFVLAALLLTAPARGAERSATFRVAVRVVRPFAVSVGRAVATPARVVRSGEVSPTLARVTPPLAAPGSAFLAGTRGAIQLPCDASGCEVALAGGAPATVLLTIQPDGAPAALVE
jgi:hypothetical protein